MIDTGAEELLTLGGLVRRLPPVDGVRPNISTAWRWATNGIRGHRLETTVVGGRRVTTMSAYERFRQAILAGPAPAVESLPSPVRKRKRLANAGEVLKRAGIRRQETVPA